MGRGVVAWWRGVRFPYVALGSAGESVSGFAAFRKAGQNSEVEFGQLDEISLRLENRLLKLIEQLERKRDSGDWTDTLVMEEWSAGYGSDSQVEEDRIFFQENAAMN